MAWGVTLNSIKIVVVLAAFCSSVISELEVRQACNLISGILLRRACRE